MTSSLLFLSNLYLNWKITWTNFTVLLCILVNQNLQNSKHSKKLCKDLKTLKAITFLTTNWKTKWSKTIKNKLFTWHLLKNTSTKKTDLLSESKSTKETLQWITSLLGSKKTNLATYLSLTRKLTSTSLSIKPHSSCLSSQVIRIRRTILLIMLSLESQLDLKSV